MNKIKQLIFVIISLIVASLVIGGTLNSVKTDIKNQTEAKKNNSSTSITNEDKNIQREIAFIKIIDKYNMGKRSSGYVIDKNGLRYDFNFYDKVSLTHEQILDEVEKTINKLQGVKFISETDMSSLCNILNDVEDIEFKSETNEYENTTETLYGVVYKDKKANLIKIFSSGSINESPVNYNIKSIKTFILSKENEYEDETASKSNDSTSK